MRVDAVTAQVVLRAYHEERPGLLHRIQSGEINVPSIQHIEGAWFTDQRIQEVDFVYGPLRDMDHRGNVAPQVQERMQLDGPLAVMEPGPGTKREAELNSRRVEGVDGVRQGPEFKAQRLFQVVFG